MTPLLAPALLALAQPVQAGAPVDGQTKLPAAARAVTEAPPGALVVAHPRHAPGDPFEHWNRRFFRSNQRFDRRFFRPAALGYRHAVPAPVRSGLRNLFSNLKEPVVFLNYLLQLKPGKAAETLGRFAINSTLGLGGVIDIAKLPGVKLPHRDNGFGDTLALYGVKPGPYLFLPFIGPTTLRDLLGGTADGAVLPTAVGTPFDRLAYQIPHGVITGLDARAEADADLQALFAGAVDPYATLRSVYLQNRAGEIAQLRGTGATRRAPADAPLADPAAQPGSTAAPELQDPLADPAARMSPATATPSTAPELQDPLSDPAAQPAG